MKRKIVGFLVCTLLITTIIPFSVNSEVNKDSTIIYVDDSGGADFTKIQDAINSASDGDTIYVYSGFYYENVLVDKQISLLGEDRDTTVIDGGKIDNVISINVDNVKIENVSVRNSPYRSPDRDSYAGIHIISNNNFIVDCKIYDNYWGISVIGDDNHIRLNNIIRNVVGMRLEDADYNIINKNSILDNDLGIVAYYSNGNSLVENKIVNTTTGLGFEDIGEAIIIIYSNNNLLSDNHILSNDGGIVIVYSDNNEISNNNIKNNAHRSIKLDFSRNNLIYENNFINNGRFGIIRSRIFIFSSLIGDYSFSNSNNKWDRNYWDRPRSSPFIIFGLLTIKATSESFSPYPFIPFYQFDSNPAKEPYDISMEV